MPLLYFRYRPVQNSSSIRRSWTYNRLVIQRQRPVVRNSSFRLTKWYLDCVSEIGDTAIVYCADLHWRGVSLRHASVLSTRGEHVSTRSTWTRVPLPEQSGSTIRLEISSLGISGSWCAGAAAQQRCLFSTPAGELLWDCLQPRSGVAIRVADDHRELTGLGYAERITLTVPPWQLPIDTLYWGRFLSADDSLTWIDWAGGHRVSFAIHNGLEHPLAEIDDTRVATDSADVTFHSSQTLREGPLGTTVLRRVPMIRKLLPQAILQLDEHKFRSRGNLKTSNRSSSGWAIHEVVHWKS